MAEKARYWSGVLYPENMIENWKEDISEILQLPFVYCIHDKDTDKEGSLRKLHIHLVIVFPNTTTKKYALSVFNKLSKEGFVCCPVCENVHSIRFVYDYLIHDTDDCRKKKKHLYKKTERVSGNGFDIGSYEQISVYDKLQMCKELADIIDKNGFEEFLSFYQFVMKNFSFEYFEILKVHSGFFERLCKGNYQYHVSSNHIQTL